MNNGIIGEYQIRQSGKYIVTEPNGYTGNLRFSKDAEQWTKTAGSQVYHLLQDSETGYLYVQMRLAKASPKDLMLVVNSSKQVEDVNYYFYDLYEGERTSIGIEFVSFQQVNEAIADIESDITNHEGRITDNETDLSTNNTANALLRLNASAKIPDTQIPALAITDTYTAGSEAEQLGLTIEQGDVCIRTDESKSYINKIGLNTAMSDWAELQNPGGVNSVNGETGDVSLILDEIPDGTTYKRIAGIQDLEINDIDASGKISLNFGHDMYGIGGEGRAIPTDVNFNGVINGGLYQSIYMTSGGLSVNRPEDRGSYYLTVIQLSGGYVFQQATRVNSAENKTWVRQRYADVWGKWCPLYRGKGEYTFRAKWTGDLKAGTGTPYSNGELYQILENTDNKLSSVIVSVDNLCINFQSGFITDDDIIIIKLGHLATYKRYNRVLDPTTSINVHSIYSIIQNNALKIAAYDSSNTRINMLDDIGSNENFVEVIIRKRG